MYVVCVSIEVKPEHIDSFIEATLANHRATRGEPGNLRFDVLRGAEDPARFMLYEVYLDEASFRAHQQNAHYFAWRDAVADWMAAPRQAAKFNSIAPEAPEAWRG